MNIDKYSYSKIFNIFEFTCLPALVKRLKFVISMFMRRLHDQKLEKWGNWIGALAAFKLPKDTALQFSLCNSKRR